MCVYPNVDCLQAFRGSLLGMSLCFDGGDPQAGCHVNISAQTMLRVLQAVGPTPEGTSTSVLPTWPGMAGNVLLKDLRWLQLEGVLHPSDSLHLQVHCRFVLRQFCARSACQHGMPVILTSVYRASKSALVVLLNKLGLL